MKKLILGVFVLFAGLINIAWGYSSYGPDLEISDITYNTDTSKIVVKIYNRGNVSVTRSFRIKIEAGGETNYYYVDKDISSGNYITLNYNVDNFSIDGERTLISAEVDIDDSIDEKNESNNSYSDYIYFNYQYHDGYDDDLPDLKIKDVTYDSSNDQIRVKVANDGDGDINDKFKIRTEVGGKYYTYYFDGYIKSNNYKRVNIDLGDMNLKRGNYNVKVTVDYDDQVDESSEGNNTYNRSIYIYNSDSDYSSSYDNNDDYDYDYDYNDNCSRRDDYYDCCDGYYNSCRRQTGSADLKVGNISYSTTTEQLSIRIDNIGKKDITQSFKVKVTVDGETYSYTINERINAGSNKYLKIDVDNLDIRRTGTYNVRAQLDTSNVIKESDKTNNSLTSSVYFNLNDGYNDDDDDNYYDRNVDLYISQIYYDDNDNNMIIRIKNKGGERVTKTFKMKIEVNSHTYYFYVNEAIGSNDYIDYEISIDKLDVREGKTYTVKVRLDINNNISERSESNNYYSESVDFED